MTQCFESFGGRFRPFGGIITTWLCIEPEDGNRITGTLVIGASVIVGFRGRIQTFFLPLCRDQMDFSSSPATTSVTS